ncbi:pyridoxamine 5'-phosphate oxidase family protein [Nonomuraea ferruginea]
MTTNEIAYLNGQLLGRLATVGPGGRPHLVTVGVFYDPESGCVVIGGARRHRHVREQEVPRRAAASRRGVHRGRPGLCRPVDAARHRDPGAGGDAHRRHGAELGERIGANMPFDPAWIRIRARRVRSWGGSTPGRSSCPPGTWSDRLTYASGFIR